MYKSVLVVALVIFAFNLALAQQSAVTIYMKDGKVLTGEILKRTNLIVQFRDLDGNVHVLFPEDIKEIYNNPVSSRSVGEMQQTNSLAPTQGDPELILLKDGTSIRGHIVAQDASDLVVQSDMGRLVIPKERVKSIQYGSTDETAPKEVAPEPQPASTPAQPATSALSPQVQRDRQVIIIEQRADKSPVLSWALSFFVFPGLGQYYNGDAGKGTIQLVTWVGGIAAILGGADSNSDGLAYAGASMILGSWVWSFVDAPMSSMRMNYENRLERERMSFLPERYNHFHIGIVAKF